MRKTVLITGATSGIGEACARKFAEVPVPATHQAGGTVIVREQYRIHWRENECCNNNESVCYMEVTVGGPE